MEYNVSTTFSYGSSRYGFNHFADLKINGEVVESYKIHYINRTWESYCGRSVRRGVCYQWLEGYENATKDEIKARLGVSRATPKVKALVAEELANDPKYMAVKAHYESL